MRLMAVGGGGFTHLEDPELDSYMLSLLPVSARIGYVGHANQDNSLRMQRFYQTFESRTAKTSHLPLGSTRLQATRWLLDLDAVYVAGGQTSSLINSWRQSELHLAFAEAARAGVLLVGVSAGAMCWFESCLSDLPDRGLSPLTGLGLFKGCCCPHYDSDSNRQPALHARIANGELPESLAIDDGVAVLLNDSGVQEVVSSRALPVARRVSAVDGEAISEILNVRRLSSKLK